MCLGDEAHLNPSPWVFKQAGQGHSFYPILSSLFIGESTLFVCFCLSFDLLSTLAHYYT